MPERSLRAAGSSSTEYGKVGNSLRTFPAPASRQSTVLRPAQILFQLPAAGRSVNAALSLVLQRNDGPARLRIAPRQAAFLPPQVQVQHRLCPCNAAPDRTSHSTGSYLPSPNGLRPFSSHGTGPSRQFAGTSVFPTWYQRILKSSYARMVQAAALVITLLPGGVRRPCGYRSPYRYVNLAALM